MQINRYYQRFRIAQIILIMWLTSNCTLPPMFVSAALCAVYAGSSCLIPSLELCISVTFITVIFNLPIVLLFISSYRKTVQYTFRTIWIIHCFFWNAVNSLIIVQWCVHCHICFRIFFLLLIGRQDFQHKSQESCINILKNHFSCWKGEQHTCCSCKCLCIIPGGRPRGLAVVPGSDSAHQSLPLLLPDAADGQQGVQAEVGLMFMA